MSGVGAMFITGKKRGKSRSGQVYRPGMRLAVYPAATLLADKQHRFVLEHVESISLLSSKQHEELYQQFIERFVEFVQVIPERNDDPLCGLMNQGIRRGVNALHQFVMNHPKASALERYAIFTAGVLLDVAHVVVNQRVFIVDESGSFIKHWDPFAGSMVQDTEAEFYKLMPLSSAYQRNSHVISILLARQLLAGVGYEWLASDLQILTEWLDALRDEGDGGAGRFTHVLQLFKHEATEGYVKSLNAIAVKMEESPATVHGDAFFEWLKEGLANNAINVNTPDAGVHVTPEGVFLDKPAIFKQFIDLYDVPVNMFSVFQQFGNLFGLTKLSGIDYRIDQLFSESPGFSHNKSGFSGPLSMPMKQMREGVIIADPSLVFMQGDVPSVTQYYKNVASKEKPQNLPRVTPNKSAPKNKPK